MLRVISVLLLGLLLPGLSLASGSPGQLMNLTQHWVGYAAIAVFYSGLYPGDIRRAAAYAQVQTCAISGWSDMGDGGHSLPTPW